MSAYSISQDFLTNQKAGPTPAQQERTARDLSAKFLEMVLKPMIEHSSMFGGDSIFGSGAASENLIKPMMLQNITTSIANKGNAMGLYPVFLKAVQRVQKNQEVKS